jgi:hypothetical protein
MISKYIGKYLADPKSWQTLKNSFQQQTEAESGAAAEERKPMNQKCVNFT